MFLYKYDQRANEGLPQQYTAIAGEVGEEEPPPPTWDAAII